MIRVLVVRNYEELSLEAALRIAETVKSKPDAVLGFATGGTPIGCYRELAQMHRVGGLSFSRVSTFNLDEYVGLAPDNAQSYHYYMFENLFNHVDVKRSNIHIPNGMAEDLEEECRSYEDAIKQAGGIDLQLLGIGRNGHIGFNEPGSPFDSRTRVVRLSEQTRMDNARFFKSLDDVPMYAITMGIATIMEAKRIILLASGEAKAEAIAKAIKEPKTVMVPASVLQDHPDCLFIIDKKAASLL